MRRPLRSVRMRLTIWYTAALASIILVFALGIYIFVRSSLLKQLDRQLNADFGTIKTSVGDEPDELEEIEQHGTSHLFKVAEDGRTIYRTAGWGNARLDRAVDDVHSDFSRSWTSADGKHYRIRTAFVKERGRDYFIAVACDAEPVVNSLRALAITLVIALPCMLVLAVAGGYFLSGRALSPIGAMAAKAHQITAERLHERLPVDNPDDEFGRLAVAFNNTLSRLQDSFDRLRRFTADASHELRTPLTALRSVGEVGLRSDADLAYCRNVIGSMLEEADRLTLLVDSLLTLTRAESGRGCLKTEPLDIPSLVNEVVERLNVLAEEKEQTLTVEARQPVTLEADRITLRQALINILDNAIKYTANKGHIRIVIKTTVDGQAVVEITDDGPGIAPEHQQKLFDRFYRIEKGRSSGQGGAGLGLAIARRAVEINGGRIELESEQGKGSTFRIILPVRKGGGAT